MFQIVKVAWGTGGFILEGSTFFVTMLPILSGVAMSGVGKDSYKYNLQNFWFKCKVDEI